MTLGGSTYGGSTFGGTSDTFVKETAIASIISTSSTPIGSSNTTTASSGIKTNTFTQTILTESDTTATPLGSVTFAASTTTNATATANVFAVTTPESSQTTTAATTSTASTIDNTTVGNVTGQPQTGSFQTTTNITGAKQTTLAQPITPTLSILTMVDKTGVGIEGAFADSLAASVGAQTSIKVAKTEARTNSIDADIATTAVVNAVLAVFDAIDASALGIASSLTRGDTAALSTTTIGQSSSDADIVTNRQSLSAFALFDDTITDAIATTMATAVDALTTIDESVSQTEAAAFLTTAVTRAIGTSTSDTGVVGTTTLFDMANRSSVAYAQAKPLINPTLVSTVQVKSDSTAAAIGGTHTLANALPLSALIRLYYTAQSGYNDARVITEQNVRITNSENAVTIQN